MSSKNKKIANKDLSGLNIDEEIKKEQEILEQQELKAEKLKKKLLVFGIVLIVLIIAYVALALYNKTIV